MGPSLVTAQAPITTPFTLTTSQCPSMCPSYHFHLLLTLLLSLRKNSKQLNTFPSLLLLALGGQQLGRDTSKSNPVAFSLVPARCSPQESSLKTLFLQLPQPGLTQGSLSLPVTPRHT